MHGLSETPQKEVLKAWALKNVLPFTVKVESSRAVLVDLFDDIVQVFLGQLVVDLSEDLLQRISGNVAVI